MSTGAVNPKNKESVILCKHIKDQIDTLMKNQEIRSLGEMEAMGGSKYNRKIQETMTQ